ncbi:MAG: ArsI/CadI family heavy metal resistance metalloenzyme [Candidatus Rokuibacteriota bacterium]
MMNDAPRVHVHMAVASLERSTAFYEKFLGVSPVKQKPGYAKFLPVFGPLNLALSEARAGDGRGAVDHMGIQVESQASVVRELQRVKAAGLAVREEFGVDCCHANQDKFWVSDPDGVEWEVYVLNHDLEDSPACRTDVQHVPATASLGLLKTSSCCSPS